MLYGNAATKMLPPNLFKLMKGTVRKVSILARVLYDEGNRLTRDKDWGWNEEKRSLKRNGGK